MTTLAARPVADPDQLDLFASTDASFADAFRDACWSEATASDGWVDPNRVRARLLGHLSYEPRQLSALWSSSCSRSGFLVKTDVEVAITGDGSRGNGNKNVRLRRWVGSR